MNEWVCIRKYGFSLHGSFSALGLFHQHTSLEILGGSFSITQKWAREVWWPQEPSPLSNVCLRQPDLRRVRRQSQPPFFTQQTVLGHLHLTSWEGPYAGPMMGSQLSASKAQDCPSSFPGVLFTLYRMSESASSIRQGNKGQKGGWAARSLALGA